MMYNISGLSQQDKVLDEFPHLSYHQPFADYGSGVNDVWLRFIVYYCDSESPFAHLFTEDRLFACVDAAGIPRDDPRLEEVLRWESESIQEMAWRLFGDNPPKQLTPNEGLLSMAVEYRRIQSPATFDALIAARKLMFEVLENTLTPVTKENVDEQIQAAESIGRRLAMIDSVMDQAESIDALSAKMRRKEQEREARKISREERISKGNMPEEPTGDTSNSGPDYGAFYSSLIGGFTPDQLDALLGSEYLGLYDFKEKQPKPAVKSGTWASLFWALKLRGFLADLTAAEGERLIRSTFKARVSKSRITDIGREDVDLVTRRPVRGTKVEEIYNKLEGFAAQILKTPTSDK